MQARKLRDALEDRGLVVLDVAASHTKAREMYVYLHGPAGQWVDGEAEQLIASVPGVQSVKPSKRSEVIFVVTVQSPHDGEGREQ